MPLEANRNAHREEGGKNWEKNGSIKILRYSDTNRMWKI